MTQNTPQILYKYRSVDERAISMLALDQLYFASPREFNDPFDCRAQRNQARNFREEIANFIRMDDLRRGLSESEIEANLERIRQHPDIVRSSRETDADEAALRRHIDEEIGIVSLTSCNNSILMWSHYANFHRGFCIGFNTVNLGFPDNSINEVIYVENIARDILFQFFTAEDSSEDRFLRLQLEINILSKYRDWQYEKEWRIMGIRGIGTYPPSAICEIIFGLNCSDENKVQVRRALGNKTIKYFQAEEGEDDFSINIVPIE